MTTDDVVRRVVLGTGADGRSRVTADGPPPVVHRYAGGHAITELWATETLPPVFDGDDPTVAHAALDMQVPAGQTRFWIAEFPRGDDQPVRHATDSVDYLVVMSGSVVLELDDGEVRLHAGDVAVQRGNQH